MGKFLPANWVVPVGEHIDHRNDMISPTSSVFLTNVSLHTN